VQDSAYLDVNSHGVLRVPGPLWLGFAVLARYWILMLVVAVSARRSRESVLLLGHDGVPWAWLLAQLPIVLLMLAAAQRVPTGGRWARLLWRNGRLIVTLTALLNLGWTAHLLWLSDDWALWPELLLASFCLIDLAIALAVWRDKFFAQLFKEFPAAPSDGEKASGAA
jgi:Protein of unknown function (DUF2919)